MTKYTDDELASPLKNVFAPDVATLIPGKGKTDFPNKGELPSLDFKVKTGIDVKALAEAIKRKSAEPLDISYNEKDGIISFSAKDLADSNVRQYLLAKGQGLVASADLQQSSPEPVVRLQESAQPNATVSAVQVGVAVVVGGMLGGTTSKQVKPPIASSDIRKFKVKPGTDVQGLAEIVRGKSSEPFNISYDVTERTITLPSAEIGKLDLGEYLEEKEHVQAAKTDAKEKSGPASAVKSTGISHSGGVLKKLGVKHDENAVAHDASGKGAELTIALNTGKGKGAGIG